jgi:hypothetical protein
MKLKFILALVAMAGFSALPAFAQHGHGGGSGGGGGHDSHASSSSSSHGGDHDGKADKDGDSHGGGHGHHGSIASKLARDPKLSAKLSALLPPGTDLAAASAGFKNLGQFVAAVHVSKNLGIPFDQLKSKMTGPPPLSLGKAITALAPTADAKAALKQAKQQAKADLHSDDGDNDGDHDGAKHASATGKTHDADAAGHDADDKAKTP